MYEYESTAYVSAFSNNPSFLEDEVNLNIMGYAWQARRKSVDEYWKNPSGKFLVDNNISYVYIIKNSEKISLDMPNIFENSKIAIYKIK